MVLNIITNTETPPSTPNQQSKIENRKSLVVSTEATRSIATFVISTEATRSIAQWRNLLKSIQHLPASTSEILTTIHYQLATTAPAPLVPEILSRGSILSQRTLGPRSSIRKPGNDPTLVQGFFSGLLTLLR